MELSHLKEIIPNYKNITLKKGEILYHEGDKPEYVYFLESGLVGLFHISENGSETFLRVFSPNNILGHRSFFAEENYHATSMALCPTKIVAISKEQCQNTCSQDPSFLKNITRILAKDLREAELRLAGLQDKTAGQRIAESLVYLKLKYPQKTWTRKEIAEYSCSTYETVTRLMTKAEKEDIIKKIGRDFEILDIQKLLKLK
ncbi:MAG: Crp/Fnr family transcriptional regulator [Bacteriovoracaceae bacterium]|jgi:CRP-like cAMP-binding protein|nr:hypothetical protein [Halobacteriovoraceae bacterium]MDP7319468.1 Crp/Fnr family transcriptional regulator [Bacteriovoracaceae bacterium]